MINGVLGFLQNMFSVPPNTAIWFEIGVIIVIAAFLALLARVLKQPLVLAYILTGLIMSPSLIGVVKNSEVITTFSEFGIAFLLFFAGLEMNIRKIKEIGKTATSIGIIQFLALAFISFLILLLFSFRKEEIIFLAIAIPFSSALIVKLLGDKHRLDTLHARIAIGILLVQDIIAIIALTILSTKTFAIFPVSLLLLKAAIIASFAFLLSKTIINPLFKFSARSTEMLFLSATAVCFLFVLLALLPFLGMPSLSVVVGAFIAGVMLANSPFKTEIQGSIKGLRDFFVLLFFVSIGMQLVIADISKIIIPSIALVAVVLLAEPLITMVLVRISGYTKRTSFFTGFYQAQTSEVSLIIVMLGVMLGHVGSAAFSVIVLVTIITMAFTTLLVEKENFFYAKFSKILDIFEKLPEKEKLEYASKEKKDIALFGCHRMGTIFLKAFSRVINRVVVIDINPDVIKSLIERRISCIYGDIINPVILDKINLKELKLVISTVPEEPDNLFLIEKVKKANPNALVFVTADHISEALELYEKGADYVIVPQVLGGERGLAFLKEIIKEKKYTLKAREDHIRYLKDLRSFI